MLLPEPNPNPTNHPRVEPFPFHSHLFKLPILREEYGEIKEVMVLVGDEEVVYKSYCE